MMPCDVVRGFPSEAGRSLNGAHAGLGNTIALLVSNRSRDGSAVDLRL